MDTSTVDEPSTTSGSGTTGTIDAEAVTCPCSRRPGANNSSKCARGVGETVNRVVGPDGGLVSLHAQQGDASGVDFSLEIPPNSFSDEVEIEITETTDPPPAELVDYSPIYRVEPTDVSPEFPIDLVVPYGGNDGVIPATLGIYFAENSEGPFEAISDSYLNAGFLQGSTTKFGVFLAAAPRSADQAECP